MAGQSVNFDFTSRGASELAGDFRKTGDSAALAAKGARLLSDALEKQRKASDVSAGAAIALAKADKILDDAEHMLADGALEAEFALKREAEAAQKAGRANEDSAAKTSGLAARMTELAGTGGIPGGGMGAAAAAGIALSPVLITVGAGLGGLALGAAGTIGPLLKAAHSAGGLQGAMAKLDPEQRKAAQSLLGLQHTYQGFEKALAPAVLSDFNSGIRVAGHLLHDLQPVSIATGKALGGVLNQIDATFAGQSWQQFFAFMARTAGPDVRQLGGLFTALLQSLPPLVEGLQPVASGMLLVGTDAAKALGPVGQLLGMIDRNNHNIQQGAKGLDAWALSLTNHIPGFRSVNNAITAVQHNIQGTGNQAKTAGPKTDAFGAMVYTTGQHANVAAAHLQTMAQAVTALNTAESTSLNNQLAYTNALLASKQGAIALRTALKASGDRVGYHTQKEQASFSAANTYIGQLETTALASWKSGHGTDGASAAIRNALPLLLQVKTKNRDYWQELRTLKQWLDKLNAEKLIHDVVKLSGSGAWTFGLSGTGSFPSRPIKGRGAKGIRGAAAGVWLVGEEGPELAWLPKGTHVLPAKPTAKVMGGLAGGTGLVPSYAGNVKGLKPWGQDNFSATLMAMTAAFVRAGKAQQAALSAGGGFAGPGGGAPSANAALARRLYPAWGSGAEWAAWNALVMGESGWSNTIMNASSGAYGIAQALPASKYPLAGRPPSMGGSSNPTAQITWQHGYITGTPGYGDPINTYGKWLSRSPHWYGKGLDAIISHPTLIGVGESGPEHVRVTPRSSGGRGEQLAPLLEAAIGRLDDVIDRLDAIADIGASAPGRTGRALGETLGGAVRSSAYADMYGSR